MLAVETKLNAFIQKEGLAFSCLDPITTAMDAMRRDAEIVVISGGQTGVDRGALRAAMAASDAAFRVNAESAAKVCIGGYCPAGRRAEDGPIPAKFPMADIGVRDYRRRTRANIDISDATIVMSRSTSVQGGTAFTMKKAGDKAVFIKFGETAGSSLLQAFYDVRPKDPGMAPILNFAGPRESKNTGIEEETLSCVDHLLMAVLWEPL